MSSFVTLKRFYTENKICWMSVFIVDDFDGITNQCFSGEKMSVHVYKDVFQSVNFLANIIWTLIKQTQM